MGSPDLSVHGSVLLVGNTVRYLAQSAAAAGIAAIGVDRFADADTVAACQTLRRVPHLSGLGPVVEEAGIGEANGWSYGAGFEQAPDELDRLVRRWPNMLGNDPGVLHLLAEPKRFFALLDALEIAYPEISHTPPGNPRGWLWKAAGRCGGYGVRLARDAGSGDQPAYYQAFINGPLCSLLFAADGSDIQVVGFNHLFARYPAAGDFCFGGAIGGVSLTAAQAEVMTCAARRLTGALRLRGMNGLDFVVSSGQPLLLELNARPPATLELYEDRFAEGGLIQHIEACRGRLPPLPEERTRSGMRVVYARREMHVGEIAWPAWVRDRPQPGSQVPADAPLCTVHAQGGNVESVAAMLRERVDQVSALFTYRTRDAA